MQLSPLQEMQLNSPPLNATEYNNSVPKKEPGKAKIVTLAVDACKVLA